MSSNVRTYTLGLALIASSGYLEDYEIFLYPDGSTAIICGRRVQRVGIEDLFLLADDIGARVVVLGVVLPGTSHPAGPVRPANGPAAPATADLSELLESSRIDDNDIEDPFLGFDDRGTDGMEEPAVEVPEYDPLVSDESGGVVAVELELTSPNGHRFNYRFPTVEPEVDPLIFDSQRTTIPLDHKRGSLRAHISRRTDVATDVAGKRAFFATIPGDRNLIRSWLIAAGTRPP